MNDSPQRTLIDLIAQHGRGLINDPRRCEALLRDLCSEYRREINVLIGALKEGVAAELLATQSGVPEEILLARLTKRLRDDLGMAEDAACWAVESWALALGIVSLKQPTEGREPGEGEEEEGTVDERQTVEEERVESANVTRHDTVGRVVKFSETMNEMYRRLDRAAARTLMHPIDISFRFDLPVGGWEYWHIRITRGNFSSSSGYYSSDPLIITSPEVWLEILRGSRSLSQTMRDGLLSFQGADKSLRALARCLGLRYP